MLFRFHVACGSKIFKIPAVVHDLIVQADIVRDGLSGVVAVEAVDLLKVRVRDLADVLADLDLRMMLPASSSTAASLYTQPNTGSLRAVMSRSPTPNRSICAP